ncbi:hypothetical protein [Gimesia sp.]|uniref:hypothetical protein n=1 Tax=Gimesia sp. TaxID=2024833 RepID=UPI000C4995DE|nr:hypothetical protein [Gimesia sp.]MAX35697.1 hypothetical protein [Gimesia sp.]HBL47648.1 hypothetical protein [Planctomycetaceae bacterium]
MNTNQSSDSFEVLLKNRQQTFGAFCKIAGKASELSLASQTHPMIDERLMSARAIINTPREDREGDIIEPAGVQLENFRKNPVVLWEHGLGEITCPIAKCQHPDGRLAIEVDQEKISATSYFTSKSLESLQIFHLIAEGLVRATSVRALPIKSSTRKTANSRIGIVLEQWELIEWSWGALGVNPDAIARTLDRGTIEGRKIVEPLLKSLRTVLPQKKHQIPGWSLTGTDDVTDNQHLPLILSENIDNPRVHDTSSRPKLRDQPQKLSASNTENEYDLGMSVPPGALILKSISSCFSDMKKNVRSKTAELENSPVKSFLEKLLLTLEFEQENLKKTFAENYAQFKLVDDNSEELNANNDSDSIDFPGASEITHRLKRIASKNHSESASQLHAFSDHQCQQIADVIKRTNLLAQQKKFCDENRLLENVEALSRVVKELRQKVSDLLPHI